MKTFLIVFTLLGICLANCPSQRWEYPWHFNSVENSCYSFLSDMTRDYVQSKAECSAVTGGHLAKIGSEQEADFIDGLLDADLVHKMTSLGRGTTYSDKKWGVWIGGDTTDPSTSYHHWYDGTAVPNSGSGSPSTVNGFSGRWAFGEPNNGASSIGIKASRYKYWSGGTDWGTYRWIDSGMTGGSFSLVFGLCEVPALPTTTVTDATTTVTDATTTVTDATTTLTDATTTLTDAITTVTDATTTLTDATTTVTDATTTLTDATTTLTDATTTTLTDATTTLTDAITTVTDATTTLTDATTTVTDATTTLTDATTTVTDATTILTDATTTVTDATTTLTDATTTVTDATTTMTDATTILTDATTTLTDASTTNATTTLTDATTTVTDATTTVTDATTTLPDATTTMTDASTSNATTIVTDAIATLTITSPTSIITPTIITTPTTTAVTRFSVYPTLIKVFVKKPCIVEHGTAYLYEPRNVCLWHSGTYSDRWTYGGRYCGYRDSQLAKINNTDINAFVRQMFPFDGEFWVGLNCMDSYGDWQWKDRERLVLTNGSKWAHGQSNEDIFQRCAYIKNDYIHGAVLHDDFCGMESRHPLLCEYSSDRKCPFVWVPKKDVCYLPSETRGSYDYAVSKCHSMSSDILVIKNEEELQTVAEISSLETGGNYFIGLRINVSTGEVRWEDGSPVTFTRWGPGQPKPGKECVILVSKLWFATECQGPQNFICKTGVAPSYINITEKSQGRVYRIQYEPEEVEDAVFYALPPIMFVCLVFLIIPLLDLKHLCTKTPKKTSKSLKRTLQNKQKTFKRSMKKKEALTNGVNSIPLETFKEI
ncbi:unnamed protein product [Owenia fusiformis]|uniref:Uncharacterized protein n=1 Tax=Owenia fusiformis TaxID=6347 RepID=A0A8J1TRB4_OWEFU|nr:unnamed protein product [Owenia fusiformis]